MEKQMVEYGWATEDNDYAICSNFRLQEYKRRGHLSPPERDWRISKEFWLFVARKDSEIIGFCNVIPGRQYIDFKKQRGEKAMIMDLVEQYNSKTKGQPGKISIDESVFCQTLYMQPMHRSQLGAFKLYQALRERLLDRGCCNILFGVMVAEENLVSLYKKGGAVELGREDIPSLGEAIWMVTPINQCIGQRFSAGHRR